MKTAESILEEACGRHYVNVTQLQKDIIFKAMKLYAEQAIDECAECAEAVYMGDRKPPIVHKGKILDVKFKLK